ncbi:IS66 family insertion sequence element accessory protein TnpB [Pseudomonas sp. 2995-1]
MKVLVHDGFGIWLAARRLNQGRFHWLSIRAVRPDETLVHPHL